MTRASRRTILLLTAVIVGLVISSGFALAVTSKQCEPDSTEEDPCRGTKGDDLIRGTEEHDVIEGRSGNDTIKARGGSDILFGGPGNDTLFEGPSFELAHPDHPTQGFLCGGRGDDQLRGGPDFDIYAFEDGWGQDTISREAEEGTFDIVAFTGCDLYSTADRVTVDLTIDLSLGKAFETATGESGANTVSWSTLGVIEFAAGGSADDTIIGGSGYNLLLGHGGNDTINAADGGFDEIRCGDGNDTVIADASDRIDGFCENKTPAP